MNASKFSEDPKLTAYVLGELDAAEQAEVEALLRDDPEARAAVASIRATTQWIEGALAQEPLPEIEPPRQAAATEDPYRQPKAKIFNFPRFYFVTGTLAAACFTVLVALHQPAPQPVLEKRYVEVETLSLPRMAQPEEPAVASAMTMLVDEKETNISAELRRADQVAVAAKALRQEQMKIAAANVVELNRKNMTEHRITMAANAAPAPFQGSGTPGGTMVYDSSLVAKEKSEATVQLSPFAVGAVQKKDQGRFADKATATKAGMEVQGITGGTPSKKAAMRVAGGWLDAVAEQPRWQADDSAMNTEAYAHQPENPFLAAWENPLSTFSIDVDTASYANVRRMLNAGQRPPVDAVRIEELVNYFPYHYAAPAAEAEAPFAAALEVAEAPWAPTHRLVRIGLKGREVSQAARPAANLVFLLDVSGSMNQPNKLPLVKESLRLLVGKLRPDDRVAVVTYAGNSGLALPSTPVRRAAEILAAVDALTPGGSTNGAMGIQLAYDIAKANFVGEGINRVILCTDGDFNVGTTSEGELVRLIEEKARSKVFLTVLGFGMGNLKDSIMEKLADKGNGNYGYIDSRREAEKLLVEQVNGTLVTIAKDVKLQVEFNPAQVASYRLIGYENRLLRKEDFNNDQIDAGEIGAGHTVTALYEIVPVGAELAAAQPGAVDELKYKDKAVSDQRSAVSKNTEIQMLLGNNSSELLTLKVRFKAPTGDVSSKLEFPLTDRGATFAEASADFKLAAAVAGFGMILRDSPHKGSATFATVTEWAQAGLVDDAGGYRSEFLGLVGKAGQLVQ